jgi:hypothetical protein
MHAPHDANIQRRHDKKAAACKDVNHTQRSCGVDSLMAAFLTLGSREQLLAECWLHQIAFGCRVSKRVRAHHHESEHAELESLGSLKVQNC